MRQSQSLFVNTLLMTAASILMRLVGLVFQVYLSRTIGAAGIGLLSLILSVSVFAATFAISGARFAALRLVSEELGAGHHAGVRSTVRRCVAYAGTFGTAGAVLLWTFSEWIGCTLIGDGRTVLALRLLGLSLPFLSMGAVLSGYFTAVCRVLKSAAGQMFEQAVRIAVVVALLSAAAPGDVETACAAVILGNVAGEGLSFVFELALYLGDRRRHLTNRVPGAGLTRRMLRIAAPLALSAYARTALSGVQNLLVPRGLKRSGATADRALADYGTIQGMVFPVIFFPAAFFVSLSELLIPELTRAQISGREEEISAVVSRVLRLCFLFSALTAALLLLCAEPLGLALYQSAEVGRYIRAFALLMPVAYMDTVTDGMLKGLGEQMYAMRVNVADSLLSVLLVWVLVPRMAVAGYAAVLYLSEIFNFTLSICRLRKIAAIRIRPGRCALAALAAAGAGNGAALLRRLLWPALSGAGELVPDALLTLGLFALLLSVTGAVSGADAAWLRGLFRSERK